MSTVIKPNTRYVKAKDISKRCKKAYEKWAKIYK